MTMLLTRPGRTKGATFEELLEMSRPVLDTMQENVLIADMGLVLRYANPIALETLTAIADEIRHVFGLGVHELVGGSIHRMHRDPARVERILAEQGDHRLPHLAEFSFGNVTLRTKITSFEHPSAGRLGYLVSWADVSDLRVVEEQKALLATRLETAATAVDELNLSIGSIAKAAHETADLATDSARQTRALAADIVRLDTRSAEINTAIASITAVAQQTKLLALNATIEAARAGEAGKGFAVVAGEVKNLAGATATVTAEISSNLSDITELVGQLRQDIERVGDLINDIEAHQTSIAGAVEEQGAVSSDLASSISQANANI